MEVIDFCPVVIPPPEWRARASGYNNLDDLTIKGPIEQNVFGKGEYRKKVGDFDKITEGKTIEMVEDMFWKNISYSPPIYGADIGGSIMDKNIPWNLCELKSILNYGLSRKISGVNSPYLYVGSWKSMFGWHKEDLDLLWYGIARDQNRKVEDFTKKLFPEGFRKCEEFLRHKTTMINPYFLKKNFNGDLKIHKMLHNPGEFMITFGGSYHAGFNWGFNLAESVNFASWIWLGLLLKSKVFKLF